MKKKCISQIKSMLKDYRDDEKKEELLNKISHMHNDLKLELEDCDLRYGRYLIYMNSFICAQLHIHSPYYRGQIHDHGTWGFMQAISGKF